MAPMSRMWLVAILLGSMCGVFSDAQAYSQGTPIAAIWWQQPRTPHIGTPTKALARGQDQCIAAAPCQDRAALQTLPLANPQHETRLQGLWALSAGLCPDTPWTVAATWVHSCNALQIWRCTAGTTTGCGGYVPHGGKGRANGARPPGSRAATAECSSGNPAGRNCQVRETSPGHALGRLSGAARPDRAQPNGSQKGVAGPQAGGCYPRSSDCTPASGQQGQDGSRVSRPGPEGQPLPGRDRSQSGNRAGAPGQPTGPASSLPYLGARPGLRDSHANSMQRILSCAGWTLSVPSNSRTYQQMAQVATLLGATVPPTPPAAAPTHGQTSLQEQLPTALPQQNQLGALTARPQGVPAPQAVLTLQEQGLAHPANLASQLLGSQPAAQGGTAPPPQRQGRSPAPKRKLPGRTGEADKASTYYSRSPSGRSASRTPDRGAQHQAQDTPKARAEALSPTLPHPDALPSSLQGVAPPP